MIKKLTITALMLSLALLVGCGSSDSPEQAMEESVTCMEEMAAILATVKDSASAEAAKPKIEAIGKRMTESQKVIQKLGESDALKSATLMAKYAKRMQEATIKMAAENQRVMMNSELSKLLGEAMKDTQPK